MRLAPDSFAPINLINLDKYSKGVCLMENKVDDIEEMIRWIATVVQNAQQSETKRLKQALEMMLTGSAQIGGILSSRCTALARQCRPRKATPPKSAPQSGPQKGSGGKSSTDTPRTPNAAQKRPEELSSIQKGIRQADPSLADQQRALRQQIYGQQNDEVAFAKAAKAIAR
jgi:hypothetical protein